MSATRLPFLKEKLIVSGHVTLEDPRKERVGGREEFKAVQGQSERRHPVLSSRSPQAGGKALLTRKRSG